MKVNYIQTEDLYRCDPLNEHSDPAAVGAPELSPHAPEHCALTLCAIRASTEVRAEAGSLPLRRRQGFFNINAQPFQQVHAEGKDKKDRRGRQ